MRIREQLERDELDFGIVILANASSSLQTLPMAKSQIVACLPKKHPLAAKKTISMHDIEDVNLIMLKEGSFLRNLMLENFKQEGITPNIVLESNQIETIKGLIASGAGIACLLDFIVEDTPGIITLPFVSPVFVDVGLAWKKDRYVSKAAQAFIDFCQNTLKKENKKT